MEETTLTVKYSGALLRVLDNTDLTYRFDGDTIVIDTDVPTETLATLEDVMGEKLAEA